MSNNKAIRPSPSIPSSAPLLHKKPPPKLIIPNTSTLQTSIHHLQAQDSVEPSNAVAQYGQKEALPKSVFQPLGIAEKFDSMKKLPAGTVTDDLDNGAPMRRPPHRIYSLLDTIIKVYALHLC